MRKAYILFALCAGIIALSSCNKFLDETPDQRTELDSDDKLAQLIVTAYPSAHFNLISEMSSDNVTDNGDQYSMVYIQATEAYHWEDITPEEYDSAYNTWESYYMAIATANTALKYIESQGNPARLAKYRAEALLCRAYAHFVLVNIFCQHYNEKTSATDLGIPYMEVVEKDLFVEYERGTVKDVYDKIDRDIEAALPHVDDTGFKMKEYRFNRRAAHAFAARFNLYYRKDMQKVVDYATIAIGDNAAAAMRDYSLYNLYTSWDDWGNAYLDPQQECNLMFIAAPSIWGRCWAPSVANRRYTHSPSISRGETYLTSTGIWKHDTQTYAFRSLFGSTVNRHTYPKLLEYFVVTNPVSQTGEAYTVYAAFTTEESLLCRAEAYTYLEQYDKALADLTTWNVSHGTPGQITSSRIEDLYGPKVVYSGVKKNLNPKFELEKGTFKEWLIHGILHVRRVETLADGLRWFDIKRYGIAVEHAVSGKDPITLDPHDLRCAIQLPAAVTAAGMTPNPR